MGFRLIYLHLTLARSKGQGRAHFHNEYLGNGETFGDSEKITIVIK